MLCDSTLRKIENNQIHRGRKENGGRQGLVGRGGGEQHVHVRINVLEADGSNG